MEEFLTQCESIINRYIDILNLELHTSGFYAVLEIKPLEGDETNDIHLLWMLHELLLNKEQSITKKHRWLGYVQGVMIAKKYMTVLQERELTRNILNGA
jgi:hypothetical protein